MADHQEDKIDALLEGYKAVIVDQFKCWPSQINMPKTSIARKVMGHVKDPNADYIQPALDELCEEGVLHNSGVGDSSRYMLIDGTPKTGKVHYHHPLFVKQGKP